MYLHVIDKKAFKAAIRYFDWATSKHRNIILAAGNDSMISAHERTHKRFI